MEFTREMSKDISQPSDEGWASQLPCIMNFTVILLAGTPEGMIIFDRFSTNICYYKTFELRNDSLLDREYAGFATDGYNIF